ncbi:asparagine synthase (glutamine-hydrolyzing) [Devosia sp.]|uniref:asparagine synthase (glutamine-hydrolyzing) n=1 Tax=Devosia sp. TaxID=1871048 RepID=UPI0026004301|nr:asparagine synthase (glutamine-hydrolyzing) [Devosia sp.]MCR6636419.1 asparagine synthase (glutamine-hydrolyzing) [Devosia sp.]
MCGIAGILTGSDVQAPQDALEAITGRIRHRGPDASGLHREVDAPLQFGHTRLAIVDLTPSGAQPMLSHSGRYVIVMNGEIYNYRELRSKLDSEGVAAWRGSSDTEVLLAAFENWGVEAALSRAEGMFALGLWDRQERTLTLARDRFGEKPLYVGETKEGIVFASQLSAILAYPGFSGREDEDAIEMFLALSYIPEPRTPFQNVWKLPPGTYARLSPGQRKVEPVAYWDAGEAASQARQNVVDQALSTADIVQQIEKRLSDVIGNQMVADVPLGAFLSGGIDSSLVVALMQAQSSKAIKTFTIGFKDEAYDEAPYARAIAQHLGTDHTEVILDWAEALTLVERLPEIYDEPFADSSQLPTHLVSAIARRSVTVCLSGDGGDEVFAGYNRHFMATQYSRARAMIPTPLRRPTAHVLRAAAQPRFAGLLTKLGNIVGAKGVKLASEKLNKIGSALLSDSDLDLYLGLVRRDEGLVASEALRSHFLQEIEGIQGSVDGLPDTMMIMDTLTYLPGDILAKVDRAAMAVALETRVPYLDHQLFALAWSLPITDKIKGNRTKAILRDILSKHVPVEMFERPKAGFGVPIESWLRGELRDWAEANLSLFQDANPKYSGIVQAARDKFYSGEGHLHHFLWNVLMLQAWQARYRNASAPGKC